MNIEKVLRAKLMLINDLETVADNSRLGQIMKKELKSDRKSIKSLIEILEMALNRKFPESECEGLDIFEEYTFTINVEKKDNFQEGIKNSLDKVRICQ